MEDLITINFKKSELLTVHEQVFRIADAVDFEYQPEEFQEKINNILKKISNKL